MKEKNMENAEKTQEKKKGNTTFVWVLLFTLLLAGAAGGGIFFVWRNAQYLTTDNARVTARLIAVSPSIPGRLERFTAVEGRFVSENEVLGWVENGEVMRSPVNGLVIHTAAVQDQAVSSHEPIVIIADTSDFHIQANFEENYVKKLQVGQIVSLTIDPFGARRFSGYISEIGNVTAAELSGQAMFFNTGGTFTRITHLISVKINVTDDINLHNFVGVNARVRIALNRPLAQIRSPKRQVGGDSERQITARGTVESVESRNVYSELPNRINSINVKEGDRVSQGQVLATLDSEDLSIQRASAQATLRIAEIDLARAQHIHDNTRSLYGHGIAREELRQAEFALQSATAAKNLAQTQLDAANAALRRASVRSPINGVVTAVIAKQNEPAGGRMFTVEDTQNLRVMTRFREQDIDRIETGKEVVIISDANPNVEHRGKITRINPAAVSGSPVSEFETEVTVIDKNTSLRIGMNVRVRAETEEK